MRYALVFALVACGGARTEQVKIDPAPLQTSPQPTASGALSRPVPAVAGTYDLDIAATRPYVEENIAKMPPDEQQFGKMALAMIEKMTATMTLAPDGAMTTTFAMKDSTDSETRTGMWRRENRDVVLMNDAKKEVRCAIDGSRLLCKEPKQTFVFTRRSEP
jgi:hypothetical protein